MIKVTNLTKIYKSKNKDKCVAVNNVSFTLPDKGLVFVIGKSGSGKSTLLNMLGGLDDITSGSINVYGNEINKFNEKDLYSYRTSLVGFIFQDFHLLDHLTIEENIGLSLKLLKEEYNDRINEVLKKVDLEGYNNRYPYELSGGQKQRVAIARALVKNPNIILADEPTGNLDSNTTEQIMKLIKEISKEKLVIIVSHNLYDAYDYADRIIELSNGKILNDLIYNKEYSNSIRVKDDEVVLPLLRQFNDEELNKLLVECRKENIKAIKQDNSKFVSAIKTDYEDKKVKLKKSSLPLKDNLKFSFLFGKGRILNFIMSSLMTAMIVIVLALAQSIAYFDSSKIIAQEISSNNNVYSIRKNIDAAKGEKGLKLISEEECQDFIATGADVYKLYNKTTYLKGSVNVCILEQPVFPRTVFLSETFGVLQTTEEYAKKLLGVEELNIYTNGVEYKEEGIYITDFTAHSLLYHGRYKYLNQIPGIHKDGQYTRAYINGIIQTGYDKKYSELIDKMQKLDSFSDMNEEMLELYDYIIQALAIDYTFDENYIEAYNNALHYQNYQYTYKNFVDKEETTNYIKYLDRASNYNEVLTGNEAFMDYEVYNKIFGTSYAPNNLDTFKPHEITYSCYTYQDDLLISEKLYIKQLMVSRDSRIHLSDEYFLKFKKNLLVCYGLYLDSEDYTGIIELTQDGDYITNSVRMSAVQTMTKAVSVFNRFFDLLMFILIAACVFTLVGFGSKNIKSNIYEIGVLKALGCKNKNLTIMFGLHTLVIVLLTVILSISGFALFSDIANTILVESLAQLAPGYIILDLGFISFDLDLILMDCLVLSLVALFSTFVPITMLKNIKPISIIKAKE